MGKTHRASKFESVCFVNKTSIPKSVWRQTMNWSSKAPLWKQRKIPLTINFWYRNTTDMRVRTLVACCLMSFVLVQSETVIQLTQLEIMSCGAVRDWRASVAGTYFSFTKLIYTRNYELGLQYSSITVSAKREVYELRNHMSHVMRKPVLAIWEQQGCR